MTQDYSCCVVWLHRQRFEEAANAFYEGVQLEPENKELVKAFREAVEDGRKFHSANKPTTNGTKSE